MDEKVAIVRLLPASAALIKLSSYRDLQKKQKRRTITQLHKSHNLFQLSIMASRSATGGTVSICREGGGGARAADRSVLLGTTRDDMTP